jgi:hypothetical protein
MNTYPTLNLAWANPEKAIRQTVVDRASGGAVRARILHDKTRQEITLRHEWVTSAQKTTLLAFYEANLAAPFYLTRVRDGETTTLTVIFVEPPQASFQKGLLWNVEAKVVEV